MFTRKTKQNKKQTARQKAVKGIHRTEGKKTFCKEGRNRGKNRKNKRMGRWGFLSFLSESEKQMGAKRKTNLVPTLTKCSTLNTSSHSSSCSDLSPSSKFLLADIFPIFLVWNWRVCGLCFRNRARGTKTTTTKQKISGFTRGGRRPNFKLSN